MKKTLTILCLVIGLGSPLIGKASHLSDSNVTAKQFLQWMGTFYGKKTPLELRVQEKAASFRYVYVKGFLSEVSGKKFPELFATLVANGVPRSQVHTFEPSSLNSIEININYLEFEMKRISELGPQKLVIIGHSKGAAETLAWALSAPKFLQDRIQAIFLVQGALHGSPVADLFVGEGPDLDDRLPYLLRYPLQKLQGMNLQTRLKYAESWLGLTVDGGLLSLTRKAVDALWARHFKQYASSVEMLRPKVFYVLGHQAPEKTGWKFKFIAPYIQAYYGANDGLLPVSHQYLADFGTPLVDLKVDHVDLVTDEVATRTVSELRQAVAKAMMLTVTQLETSFYDHQTSAAN